MNVALITEAHCGAGVTTFEITGALHPMFWAQSSTVRALAEPCEPRGLELDLTHGVALLGMMCDLAEARWFGRTAEAWSRTIRDGDMLPADGLHSIAETDPEVRTAIVAQGCDLRTGETWTAMASFDLDDDARTVWRRQSQAALGEQYDLVVNCVRQYLATPRPEVSGSKVERFAANIGWKVKVFRD